MAITQADVDLIDDAMRAIVKGGTSVSFAGKAVTFADLDKLRALRSEWAALVSADDGEAGITMTPVVRGW